MTFGRKLQTLRKEKSLSQSELAEQLYVTRQSVSQWENDKSMPSVDLLIKLSEIYGITLDALLVDDESEAEPKPVSQTVTLTRFLPILKAMCCELRTVIQSLTGAAAGLFVLGILIKSAYLGAYGEQIFKNHSRQSSDQIFKILAIICLAAGVIIFFFGIMQALRCRKISGEHGFHLQFFADRFTINSENREPISLFYSNVKRVVESDYYLILTMKNGQRFCVDKRRIDGDGNFAVKLFRGAARYFDKRLFVEKAPSETAVSVLCFLRNFLFAFIFTAIPASRYILSLYYVSDFSGVPKLLYFAAPIAAVLLVLLFGIILTVKKSRMKRLIFGSLPCFAAIALVLFFSSALPVYNLQHDRVTPVQFTEAMKSQGLEVEDTIRGRQEYYITDCLTATDEKRSFEIMYFNFDSYEDAIFSAYECANNYQIKITSTPRHSNVYTYMNLGFNFFYSELTDRKYAYISYNKRTIIYVMADSEKMNEVQSALSSLEKHANQ